jgi:predicted  nucleic acid-binding Zn-ribbon protein
MNLLKTLAKFETRTGVEVAREIETLNERMKAAKLRLIEVKKARAQAGDPDETAKLNQRVREIEDEIEATFDQIKQRKRLHAQLRVSEGREKIAHVHRRLCDGYEKVDALARQIESEMRSISADFAELKEINAAFANNGQSQLQRSKPLLAALRNHDNSVDWAKLSHNASDAARAVYRMLQEDRFIVGVGYSESVAAQVFGEVRKLASK